VRTEEGKLHLFVAIDHTSRFAFAQLHKKATRNTTTAFLKALIAAVPYNIHTVLTDNDIQFCDLPQNRSDPTEKWRTNMFGLLCQAHGIEHRFTKPNHPWTTGQVERMNRTLKEATVRRCDYDSHSKLVSGMESFRSSCKPAIQKTSSSSRKRGLALDVALEPWKSGVRCWSKSSRRASDSDSPIACAVITLDPMI
jgi:transposase InsO family protein